jgi:hypothetical protein
VDGQSGLDECSDRLAKGHYFTLPLGRPEGNNPPEDPFKNISHDLKLEDARPKVKKASGLAPGGGNCRIDKGIFLSNQRPHRKFLFFSLSVV